jgi:SAM-dependent methyltransferase
VSAADRWRDDLERWAIPEWILAQAPESPWIHPPALFGVPERIADSPSHARAREALGDEASVLDVGCGGGVAAMALAPPARRVIGVDHQPAMLAMFEQNARARGLEVETVEGLWPDVAEQTPTCDVVTCHHVVYNVPDIVPFVAALDHHARHRVVLEMPTRHPLSTLDGAWRHFWGVERPQVPTPADLLAVLDEVGLDARSETFEAPSGRTIDPEQAARFVRVRLCLPPERDGEVRAYLDAHPAPTTRSLATVWWDRK